MQISKITRAGQITLPKKIRTGRTFSRAKAVIIEERANEIVIKPLNIDIPAEPSKNEYWPVMEYTMRDWLDEENDNLFIMPGDSHTA